MVISSRRTPIQTLPARSARAAWNSATSGRIAGTSRIGSSHRGRGERIVDHAPVGPVAHQVGAENAAQRQERHALLGRLQPGMEHRAGGVPELDPAGLDRGRRSAAPAPCSPSVTAAVSTLRNAARADQQVGLKAELRHADQMQLARPPPDQRRAPPRARSRNSPAPAPGWRRPGCARRGQTGALSAWSMRSDRACRSTGYQGRRRSRDCRMHSRPRPRGAGSRR